MPISRKRCANVIARRRAGSARADRAAAGNAALAWTRIPITSNLYDVTEKGALPEAAVLASLGCGNPTALAQLKAGRNRARSGLGRRHRRFAFRTPRRPHGQGLRPRHDGRDADARPPKIKTRLALRTSSSSRATKISRFRTIPSTSSSRIASSIFRPTRTRC